MRGPDPDTAQDPRPDPDAELRGDELGGRGRPSPGGRAVTRGRRGSRNAETVILWSMIAATVGVALVVGYISYTHAYAVVLASGETGLTAQLYPATIDGLVYGASMVLLFCARRDITAPALAWWLLAGGIVATMAANMAAGWPHGIRGVIVYGWPAPVLVGMYELLMILIRQTAKVAPADPIMAARESMAASVAIGNPYSARALARLHRIDRDKAGEVVKEFTPDKALTVVNGNGADRG